ncbi:ROK family transcriptional regulator [Limoniibacter endophyticus]|uniref:ROK family transcriptional regulator n=1 Tax=Limoniibacter endophyticus TaxID=1565040 RepID=UPI0016724A20|nr:ROK family transcriptional regulator [Limoniibacter endophyticus]
MTLTSSARAVFKHLAFEGASTRPQIGAALDLSRPTMSAAVTELEKLDLVKTIGVVSGTTGRKAAKYRVGRGAGHVIAVDAGSTHVRLRVSTLDRRLLLSRTYRLSENQVMLSEDISRAVAGEVAAALAETNEEWGPLRTFGIALPSRVVSSPGDVVSTGQNRIFSHFTPPEDVDILLENNVNCAAVAEHLHGAALGTSTFAYIQIGFKIGMGLMLSGHLIRGRNGAAGEIGHLPYPVGPSMQPIAGEVERYLGTEAFMARVQSNWNDGNTLAPGDTAQLLYLAADGNEEAIRHVARHAADIGAVVAACVSVVDPGLVVLGGGYGSSPLLAPRVQQVASQLSYPVEIVSSPLGSEATVLGIEKLAIDSSLAKLVG